MNNKTSNAHITSFNRPGFRLVSLLSALILMLLVSSCVSQTPVENIEPVENPGVFVWPAPPETPRIRYVGSLSETSKVTEKKSSTLKDALVGKEPEEKAKTLTKPIAVHADARGRVFVTDEPPDAFVMFDRNEDKVEFWGTDGMGKLSKPMGITSDSAGRIYVTDTGDHRIVVFDTNGRFVRAIGGEEIMERPVGIAVDDVNGRIYVVDTLSHKVLILDMQGELIKVFGERGNGPGQFNFPTFIELTNNGKLLVADTMNFRVQVFSTDGEFETSFGQIGTKLGNFNRLKGIATDSEGHIYAIDGSFNNFQIFDEAFNLLLWVGDGKGDAPGYFNLPVGIDVDQHDQIFVADSVNKRIQIFEYLKSPDTGQIKPAD